MVFSLRFIFLLFSLIQAFQALTLGIDKKKRLKIACAGDQVTVGNSETDSYPYFLN